MNVGELWVKAPIFPFLLVILAFWVGTSSILMWRMWYRINDLKKHNTLQKLMMEGTHNLRNQTSQLRSKGRQFSSERESTNHTEKDRYIEVPSSIEV